MDKPHDVWVLANLLDGEKKSFLHWQMGFEPKILIAGNPWCLIFQDVSEECPRFVSLLWEAPQNWINILVGISTTKLEDLGPM